MAIDNVVNSHQAVSPNEKKEEPKKISTLESVVGEFGDLFNLSIGIGAPAAAYALTGNAGVPVVSAAFIAGSGGTLTSKKFRDESLIGTLWGTILHYFTLPVKYMSNLAKGAYVALLPFMSNSIVPTTDHLLKNKSPKGLYEKLKKNYLPNVKKTFKTIWPLNLISTLFFTQQAYIVGAIGVANYLFRKFIIGGAEEPTDKTPYHVAAPNVAYKLVRNTTKGLSEAIYAIVSTLGSYLTSPAKAPEKKPEPKPIPESAPART